MKTRVLFVCLGNICRSPAAEGVFLEMVSKAGMSEHIHIDSAGTGHWHIGENPDPRTIAHAKKRGYDLSQLVARQFSAPEDFHNFDYILTMDEANLVRIQSLDFKKEHQPKIQPLTTFCKIHAVKEVPDPYYKGEEGFELVMDLLEDACEGLLNDIIKTRGSR